MSHTLEAQIQDNSISNAPTLLQATGSVATLKLLGDAFMILTEDVLQRYRANQGYVYLIHAVGTDRYKIGRSVNPPARLETLKKQSPYPLQIIECFWTPDAIADEKYFHNREYLAPHRKFGEWFEVSNERDDTLSLSSFDVLELEFTGHRPTCRQYLMQSFQSVIADSGLPTDGNYFNQAYSPIRLLYLGVTNIPALERIIFFTFNKLPSIVGNCRDSQELENTCWAACETASQLILGQELFDIAESLVRYKGK